jgi:hypothetical protein
MSLGLLDITTIIKKEFGSIDFTLHIKDKESLDSDIRNVILNMVNNNEITELKQIECAVIYIKENFETIKNNFSKKDIIENRLKKIKQNVEEGLKNNT